MRRRLLGLLVALPIVGVGGWKFVSWDHVAQDTVRRQDYSTSLRSVSQNTNAFVIRAVDGDTLVVTLDGEAGESHIRLLGMNSPETVDPRKPVECFGKEASAHIHELVDGKRVRLVADPQADERDKYNRLLRHVILEDGTDVNAAMVKDGYAYAYLSFPLNPQRRREIKKFEQEARSGQRGLWNPATCNGNK